MPFCLLVFALVSASGAHADDSVTRHYNFALDDIDTLVIEGSAGSMHFIATDKPEVTVVLTISHQDKDWFDDGIDLEAVELTSRVRDRRLLLQQTEDETNTEWTIEMPALASTRVELGVGEIEGEFGATELHIELGVGAVAIEIPEGAVGGIALSSRVGEVELSGASRENSRRAFVSQEVSGAGKGTRDLDVSVGVGKVNVTLTKDDLLP